MNSSGRGTLYAFGLPLTRRTMLFAVVTCAVIFGTVKIVHGSGAAKKSRTHVQVALACATGKARSVAAHRCSPVPARDSRRMGRRHPAKGPGNSADARHLRAYATALVPQLDASRHLFDAAAAAGASAGDPGSLDATCGNYGEQVTIAVQTVDGIPHPYPGYSPVGSLHYRVLGAMHRMAGALVLCSTGAENGDQSAIDSALSDIAAGASQMRSLDDEVHRLARLG